MEALAASAKAELAALHWSVDPQDWARPGVEAIVAAVLASLQPGAIVLLHDGCPPDELGRRPHAGRRDQTVMALAQLIPALHDRGFAIRSLPQPHRMNQCP
ncbi:peptidoglycan/xylan/chitin deacetylase (PgdA/CDA1 family) [Bradyrhizobium sp. RT6a]